MTRYIPPTQLYSSLYARMSTLLPAEVDSRVTNLVYLMPGIFLARSVQTGRLASKIPVRAKRLSVVRRLERFLANPAVRVREWYAPLADQLLRAAAVSGQVALITDGTKVSFAHQCVMVAVAYHGRALPIAWVWVRHGRGHSSQATQLALLSYVRDRLPPMVTVSLVGDTEFGHSLVLDYLNHWGWQYVLRQSGHNRAWVGLGLGWQALTDLVRWPGDCQWRPGVPLTQASPVFTTLLFIWQRGQPIPWLLATNLPTQTEARRLYKRRMWIEQLFGDLKRHGFDLESSHLRSFRPLHTLTLAVALLYVWLVTEGTHALVQGRTAHIDRSNRRDLSLFRLGIELVDSALTRGDPFQVYFDPLFVLNLVSGS